MQGHGSNNRKKNILLTMPWSKINKVTFLSSFAENIKYWNKIIYKPYAHNFENLKFTFNGLIY